MLRPSRLPTVAVRADDGVTPTYVTRIFQGYRDWKFISVTHGEGELNDIRVILGNAIAISAYRGNRLPFLTVIARLAWKLIPSEETTKCLAVPNPSFPGSRPPGIYSLWSKTRRSTRPRAAAIQTSGLAISPSLTTPLNGGEPIGVSPSSGRSLDQFNKLRLRFTPT